MKKKIFSLLLCSCLVSSMPVISHSIITQAASLTQNITASTTWGMDSVDHAITINGGTSSNPLVITVTGEVTVNAPITITGGYIHMKGDGTLKRGSAFQDHIISVSSGTLRLSHITIDGGAVWNRGSQNETLGRLDNTENSTACASALYAVGENSVLDIDDQTIIENNNGLSLANSAQTSATNEPGGAIYAELNSNVSLHGCSIIRNNRAKDGAGIYMDHSDLYIKVGEIYGNQSVNGNGAGIFLNGGRQILAAANIHNNLAGCNGGGIYINHGTTTEISNDAAVSNNKAENGGGIYASDIISLYNKACITGNQNTARRNSNTYFKAGSFFRISSQLSTDSKIGVTTALLPAASDIEIAENTNGDTINSIESQTPCFYPDEPEHAAILYKTDNKIYLTAKNIVTLNQTDGISGFRYSTDGGTTWTNYTTPFTIYPSSLPQGLILESLLEDNYTFKKWADTKTSNPLILSSSDLTSDIVYTPTAVNTPKPQPSIDIVAYPVPASTVKPILMVTAKQAATTKSKLSWNQIPDADGYKIYANYCNSKGRKLKPILVKTLKSNALTSWTMKNMTKNHYYKAYIVAYKLVNGKKSTITKSPVIHFLNRTKANKFSNPSSIQTSTSKVTLNIGKSKKVTGKVGFIKGKKQAASHSSPVRYLSSNKSVAAITSKGTIKAISSGKCTIYIYSINGLYKKVTVTVK